MRNSKKRVPGAVGGGRGRGVVGGYTASASNYELMVQMSGEGPIDIPYYKRLSRVVLSIVSAIDPENSQRLIKESVETLSVSSSLHVRDWTRLFAYSNSELLKLISENLDKIVHEYFHRSLASIPKQTLVFHVTPEFAQLTELMSVLPIYPYFHGPYLCLFLNSDLISRLMRGVSAIDFLTSENNINCHAAGSESSGDLAFASRKQKIGTGCKADQDQFLNYHEKEYALGVKLEQLVKTSITDGLVSPPTSLVLDSGVNDREEGEAHAPRDWLTEEWQEDSEATTTRKPLNNFQTKEFLLGQLGVEVVDQSRNSTRSQNFLPYSSDQRYESAGEFETLTRSVITPSNRYSPLTSSQENRFAEDALFSFANLVDGQGNQNYPGYLRDISSRHRVDSRDPVTAVPAGPDGYKIFDQNIFRIRGLLNNPANGDNLLTILTLGTILQRGLSELYVNNFDTDTTTDGSSRVSASSEIQGRAALARTILVPTLQLYFYNGKTKNSTSSAATNTVAGGFADTTVKPAIVVSPPMIQRRVTFATP